MKKIIQTKKWMENNGNLNNYHLISTSFTNKLKNPKSIHDKIFWLYTEKQIHEIEEEFVALINDCIVDRFGSVHTNDGFILKESSMRYQDKIKNKKTIKNNIVASIGNLWSDENYYHWLFESIQRVDLIKKCNYKVFDILSTIGNQKFYKESCEALKYKFYNLRLNSYQCDNLILTSLQRAPVSNYRICKSLKKMFLPFVVPKQKKERIYSKRVGDRRIIINEKEVDAIMKKYGFKTVINQENNFLKQVEMYNSASVVVGVHGANLANIVFCEPETKILEIHNPEFVGLCYWYVANYSDLDYHYLMANGKISSSREEYSYVGNCFNNITIDIKKLEQSLQLIL